MGYGKNKSRRQCRTLRDDEIKAESRPKDGNIKVIWDIGRQKHKKKWNGKK